MSTSSHVTSSVDVEKQRQQLWGNLYRLHAILNTIQKNPSLTRREQRKQDGEAHPIPLQNRNHNSNNNTNKDDNNRKIVKAGSSSSTKELPVLEYHLFPTEVQRQKERAQREKKYLSKQRRRETEKPTRMEPLLEYGLFSGRRASRAASVTNHHTNDPSTTTTGVPENGNSAPEGHHHHTDTNNTNHNNSDNGDGNNLEQHFVQLLRTASTHLQQQFHNIHRTTTTALPFAYSSTELDFNTKDPPNRSAAAAPPTPLSITTPVGPQHRKERYALLPRPLLLSEGPSDGEESVSSEEEGGGNLSYTSASSRALANEEDMDTEVEDEEEMMERRTSGAAALKPLSRSPSLLRRKTDDYLRHQRRMEEDTLQEGDKYSDLSNSSSALEEIELIQRGEKKPFRSYLFDPFLKEKKNVFSAPAATVPNACQGKKKTDQQADGSSGDHAGKDKVSCVLYNASSDMLLVGTERGLVYCEESKKNALHTSTVLHGHSDRITCFTFSSVTDSTQNSSSATGGPSPTVPGVDPFQAISSSHTHFMFASSSRDGSIMLWSATLKTKLRRIAASYHRCPPSLIRFMPYNDNYLLVAFAHTSYLTLYNCSTGLEMRPSSVHAHTPAAGSAPAMAPHATDGITTLLVEPEYYPFFFTGNGDGDVLLWTAKAELRYLRPEVFRRVGGGAHRRGGTHNGFFHHPALSSSLSITEVSSGTATGGGGGVEGEEGGYYSGNHYPSSGGNTMSIYNFQIPRLRVVLRLPFSLLLSHFSSPPPSLGVAAYAGRKENPSGGGSGGQKTPPGPSRIIRMESQLLNPRQMKNLLKGSPFLVSSGGASTILSRLVEERLRQREQGTCGGGRRIDAALEILSPLLLLVSFSSGAVLGVGLAISEEGRKGKPKTKEEGTKGATAPPHPNPKDTEGGGIAGFFSSLFSDISLSDAFGTEPQRGRGTDRPSNQGVRQNLNNATTGGDSVELKRKIMKRFLALVQLVPLTFLDMSSLLSTTATVSSFRVGATLCRDNDRFVVFSYLYTTPEKTWMEVYAVSKLLSFLGAIPVDSCAADSVIVDTLWETDCRRMLVVRECGELQQYHRVQVVDRTAGLLGAAEEVKVVGEGEAGREEGEEEEEDGRKSLWSVHQRDYLEREKETEEWSRLIQREREKQKEWNTAYHSQEHSAEFTNTVSGSHTTITDSSSTGIEL